MTHEIKTKINELEVYFFVNDLNYFLSHRKKVAEGLFKQGGTVYVFYKKGSQNENFECFKAFPLFSIKTLLKIFRLNTLSRSINSKKKVFHLITLNFIISFSVLLLPFAGHHFVWSIAGLGNIYEKGTFLVILRRKILNLYLKLLSKIFTPNIIFQNQRDYRFIRRVIGKNVKNTIVTLGSGVDFNKIPTSNYSEKNMNLVFASRLVKNKGSDIFLNIAEQLSKELRLKKNFIIFGEFRKKFNFSITEREFNRITSHNIVKYLGYQADKKILFDNALLFIYPSNYNEGVPKIVLEALSFGVPVVCFDKPYFKHIILNGHNGIKINAHKPHLFCTEISNLLNNPEKLIELSANALVYARKNFSVDKVVDDHLELYSSIK